MPTSRPARRAGRLLLLAVCAALLAALPGQAAAQLPDKPPYDEAEWAAWGLAATFDSGAPVVKFAAYVGVEDGDPLTPGNQPQVLGKLVEDITAQCSTRSVSGAQNPALSIDGAGYAVFDGTLYMECRTPDWGAMVRQLAPHLRVAELRECTCPPDRSPLWASAELILSPVAPGSTRLNPLIDARGLGLTYSIPPSGSMAQSRIGRSTGNVDSSS